MSEPVKIAIRKPGEPTRRFELRPGVYGVGSDEDNKVVLPGKEISWKHAVLSMQGDEIWVEDLDSSFGTFVDGRRVDGRVQVQSGQEIRVGLYVLVIGADGQADERTAPPPDPRAEPRSEPVPDPTQHEPVQPLVPARARAALEPAPVSDSKRAHKRQIKKQIQEELLKRLDIKRLTASRIGEKDLQERALQTIERIVKDVSKRLPAEISPDGLVKEVYDEAVGLGPLEDLLADEEVTEIMVNGPNQVYVERRGRLHLTERTFVDDASVLAIIERIVAPIGRRIDESQPYVDARLADGSRVNAIIHPLSLSGPCITIRKFSKDPYTIEDLVRFGTLPARLAPFIEACVLTRKNIIIAGGTGTGKTTLLNVVSGYLPDTERIVTIEDAAELRLTQAHVVRLEARPPNIEGRGAIMVRDLVRNALRMRPDRIVVGECRGGEALDMLQAMNTGHEGSLTTVHANSPRDVLSRLETMVLMGGLDLPIRAIREQIGSAIHLIVHLARFSDGTRRIARISEIVGLEVDRITMQDLFAFTQTGVDREGAVLGEFLPTGAVPTFLEEVKAKGVSLDPDIFEPGSWKNL